MLEKLNGVRPAGEHQWQARCPCHDDQRQSLSIRACKDGTVLLFCHACGKDATSAILEKIGLKMNNLFPAKGEPRRNSRPKREIVAEYNYCNADGELAYQVVRYEPKDFRQRRPDGDDGWLWSLSRGWYQRTERSWKKIRGAKLDPAEPPDPGARWFDAVPKVLYRVPEIVAGPAMAWVFVVEGERDVDRLLDVGLVATCNAGGAGKWRGVDDHPLHGRRVCVLPDNDEPGQKHARQVARSLHGKAAELKVLELPGLPEKGDVSDWLDAGHTADELTALAEDAPAWEPGETANAHDPQDADDGGLPYAATDRGLVRFKHTADGDVPIPLTNYTAKIVGETVIDDGVETSRELDIEGQLHGGRHCFTVPAARFAGLSWVVEEIGPDAVTYAGFGTKDHARCAIQLLSGAIPRRQVFAHSGWRRFGEMWAFLHCGGGIGPPDKQDAEVRLPDALAHLVLPVPPVGNDLRGAVRASLDVLELGSDPITFPIYAAIWRSVLGGVDFSVHLAGDTGVFKSELAALAQQHFGAGFDARHLPGSWSSTANALETLTHAAKDTILVVDDFAPAGSHHDVARLNRDADRLLRAAGNRAGRARLRSDCTMRAARNPRCLILTTGEDVPRGQSLRARLVVVEIQAGDISVDALSRCQSDAAAGLYAAALSGFIGWLGPRYEEIRDEIPRRVAELRATMDTPHRRTPTTFASLLVGLDVFLRFVADVGATSDADRLRRRGNAALRTVAEAQADHLRSADPAYRFFELLSAAVACGRAHVADPEGGDPTDAGAWGWRSRTVGAGDRARADWQPQGDRIGWVTCDGDLYLEGTAAYRVATAMVGPGGDGVTVSERTLWRRLVERRMIRRGEHGRSTVQRQLEGRKRRVLHTRSVSLVAQAGISGIAGTDPPHGVKNADSDPLFVPVRAETGDASGDDGKLIPDPVPDPDSPTASNGDGGPPSRGQERGSSPESPQSPLVRGERPIVISGDGPGAVPTTAPDGADDPAGGPTVPDGWTPAGWVNRLRRLADACAADHPDRADELRRDADAIEAAGRADGQDT